MSKQISRCILSMLVLLTLVAPLGLVSPARAKSGSILTADNSDPGITGTDPEPTSPDVVTQAVVTALTV